MKGRHDRNSLIKALIDYFTENGLQIHYARYTGYEKPFAIKRHVPDVIAFDKEKGLAYIGKCLLCSELEDKNTKEQFEDFPKMLMKSGNSEQKHLPFYIGVPHDCHGKVKESFRMFEVPFKENIQVVGL